MRIDQSGKFAATTLLRAMDAKYSTDAAIIHELFYDVKKVTRKKSDPDAKFAKAGSTGAYAVGDILNAETEEPFVTQRRGDHRGGRRWRSPSPGSPRWRSSCCSTPRTS